MNTNDIKINNDCHTSNTLMNHDDSISMTMNIGNETEVVGHSQLPSVNPYFDGRDELIKRGKDRNYRKQLYCLFGSIMIVIILICVMVGITVNHRLDDHSPESLRPTVNTTTVTGGTSTTTPKKTPIEVACYFLGLTDLRECLSTTEYDGDAVTNTLLNTIPTEIGLLKQLQTLNFNRDIHMGGTLPTEIGMLTQLTLLSITGVGLTGTIPDTIGQLSLLRTLSLEQNGFTGSIPTTFASLSNLHTIDVSSNQLTGTIPSETFGNWTHVRDVWLNMNRLRGPIPSTIGQMKYCESLILSDNHLTGSIPSSIGNMTELQVLILYNNNELTGGIPNSMTSLEHLSRIWFTNNINMNGTIPTTIRNMDVNELDFSNTKLHGSIPNALCRRFPANSVHFTIDCTASSNTTPGSSAPNIYCNCCVDPTDQICSNSTFIV